MKTTVTVRKIPTEDILNILLEMRELGVAHVNFNCILTGTQDNIEVTAFQGVNNPNQESKFIDMEKESKSQDEYIKRIIDGSS